jgi:hypothetical protein
MNGTRCDWAKKLRSVARNFANESSPLGLQGGQARMYLLLRASRCLAILEPSAQRAVPTGRPRG